MRKIVSLVIVSAMFMITLTSALAKDIQVKGYTKKDGTKVAGYTRTVKDKAPADTHKVAGYTKKDGTKVAGYTKKKAAKSAK